jgi:glycosyltransferase involved in cell wall biosynthesis
VPDPLHVLEVVPYYEPAWAFGGPPKVMSEEARELVRRGHDVTVFTTDALDADHRVEPAGAVELDGVHVHRFRNLSNGAAFHRYRFQPRGMRRALTTVRADVAHLSELRHELAILTWRACHRRDIPLVVSAHGTLPRRGGWKGRIRGLYDQAFVDPMLRGGAGFIAQTEHEGRLYVEQGAPADRVHLVPLGIDAPPAPTDEGCPDLGVPEGAQVVMFLGRIHVLKGVERLIRGFAAVAAEHPDTWLVIAGRDDGGLAAARDLAASLGVAHRVTFPGALYGARRFDAYRRADLFAITPTHFEETSLASLEAASVGTPLLVSTQAEVPHLEECGAGRTIGADDDPSAGLSDLLASDLAAAGSSAAAMIAEHHLWPRVGERVERIFRDVA